MQEARAAESEIQRGHWRRPLHGVPLALKDLIEVSLRSSGGGDSGQYKSVKRESG